MTRAHAAPLALAVAVLVWAAPRPAHAIDLYAEADLGTTMFIGTAADHAALGPAFGGKLGIGIFSWLSLGGQVSGSAHEATVPTPSVGQYFQLYRAAGELRLRGTIWKLGFYAEGSAGWAWISTNILDTTGITLPAKHNSLSYGAGGGIEYLTENPRYAIGLGGAWATCNELPDVQTVSVRLYLRYTR
jgi:hypothetical protein